MREQLLQFEGQKVHYLGRLTARKDAREFWDVCLANVEIRPLRHDIPLRDAPVTKVDHCWIRVGKTKIRGTEMLRRMEGAGTVTWYQRAGDRSVDLGLSATSGICLNALWDQIQAEPKRSERFSRMQAALEGIDEGLSYWDWTHSADEFVENMRDGVDRYLKSSALNWGARAIAPSNGRCMGLDPIKVPATRPLTKSRGFA